MSEWSEIFEEFEDMGNYEDSDYIYQSESIPEEEMDLLDLFGE